MMRCIGTASTRGLNTTLSFNTTLCPSTASGLNQILGLRPQALTKFFGALTIDNSALFIS